VPRRVVLVGLGAVGMGYDLDLDPGLHALTHASAISADPRFQLIAGVDVDRERRAMFADRYGVPAFGSPEEVDGSSDVVVVATPAGTHLEVAKRVAGCLDPRVLLLEKPMGETLADARDIVALATGADRDVRVNFHRAADPRIVEVAGLLASGATARPYRGVGWYSKGLINNASHLVALLLQWLGPPERVELTASGRDGAHGPEPGFRLRFDGCDVDIHAVRHESYDRFAVELVGDGGLIELGGVPESILTRPVVDDPITPGYRVLGDPHPIGPTVDPRRTFAHVYDDVVRVLDGAPGHLPTAAQALDVQEILNTVLTLR